jgi:hypothetical protein
MSLALMPPLTAEVAALARDFFLRGSATFCGASGIKAREQPSAARKRERKWQPMDALIPIVAIVFTFGMPVAIVVTALVTQSRSQKQRLEMLMAERRLLIEKGVTDLPPLDLTDPRQSGRRYGSLVWGVILLAIGLGLGVSSYLGGEGPGLQDLDTAVPVLGFLGLGLIGIHFVVRAYQRADEEREQRLAAVQPGLPADFNTFDDAK